MSCHVFTAAIHFGLATFLLAQQTLMVDPIFACTLPGPGSNWPLSSVTCNGNHKEGIAASYSFLGP